jgi:nitroimidazol reductase NimA-like FMN-containing flavoprotein (pyridoxamine 5'-phosphate oxidase superfamily)
MGGKDEMVSEQFLCQLSEVVLSQKLAVLATAGCTTPYVNLVAFAASPDLGRLWFATPRATRKYANLRTDSHVALLVDSRANDIRDFDRAVAATAVGRARELPDEDSVEPRAIYLAKHPQLADFVASPSCAFFEVAVGKYVVVSSFQHVTEVDMS